MMNQTLSPQDIELLSAYLDRELSSSQMTQIEARLQSESELKELLVELRRTRQVLRSLPVMRAPRNFTLTPEMAGVQPRRENKLLLWFNRLRLSSALAAILLVLVLMGDFLTGVTPLPIAGKLATDSLPAQELAVESPQEAPESLQAYQAPSAEDMERALELPAEGMLTEEESAGETAPEAEVLPEPTPLPPQVPPFRGLGGGGGGGADTPPAAPEPLMSAEQVRTVVRVSEIGLALAAVITALIAWLLRRRNA